MTLRHSSGGEGAPQAALAGPVPHVSGSAWNKARGQAASLALHTVQRMFVFSNWTQLLLLPEQSEHHTFARLPSSNSTGQILEGKAQRAAASLLPDIILLSGGSEDNETEALLTQAAFSNDLLPMSSQTECSMDWKARVHQS